MASGDATPQFRDIPGFPGYQVGSDGSVWFCWSHGRWERRMTDRWKPMKLALNQRGYPSVNLTPPEGGRYQTFRVHRLVLTAFVGPCPVGMEARHLNGIKTDCRLENLVWGTPEDNREDNRRLDAYPRGEGHPMRKLTEDQVREIRTRSAAGMPQKELAAEYGVNVPCISMIVNRKSWRHVV